MPALHFASESHPLSLIDGAFLSPQFLPRHERPSPAHFPSKIACSDADPDAHHFGNARPPTHPYADSVPTPSLRTLKENLLPVQVPAQFFLPRVLPHPLDRCDTT